MDKQTEPKTFSFREIQKYLPHRYPFLMLDRILDIEKNTYCKALKNVSGNEPFFMGHFPNYPIMPGVMINEAFAQTAGFCWLYSTGANIETSVYALLGMDKFRLRRPVFPGDQLVLEVHRKQQKLNMVTWTCRGTVNEKLIADGVLRTGSINIAP